MDKTPYMRCVARVADDHCHSLFAVALKSSPSAHPSKMDKPLRLSTVFPYKGQSFIINAGTNKTHQIQLVEQKNPT
jgi:hypothetical protein